MELEKVEVEVSVKELVDFINSQPPEQKIDFLTSHSGMIANSGCGCLFYQYVESKVENPKEVTYIYCSVQHGAVRTENTLTKYKFPCPFDFFGQNHSNFSTLQQVISQLKAF